MIFMHRAASIIEVRSVFHSFGPVGLADLRWLSRLFWPLHGLEGGVGIE